MENMNNIVFRGIDGSVAIMTLAPNADKADAIKKFQLAHPGQYEETVYENLDVPTDRSNRDNWKLKQGKIVL